VIDWRGKREEKDVQPVHGDGRKWRADLWSVPRDFLVGVSA